LRLFPRSFRQSFAADVEDVIRRRLQAAVTPWERVRIVLRSAADLMIAGVAERKDQALSPAPRAVLQGGVTVETVPVELRKPLTADQLQVSRRQFLNRAWALSFAGFLGFFGMSSLSFLWPKLTGGFGTKIAAGNYQDLLAMVGPEAGYKPMYFPEGRFYLTYYAGTGDSPVYQAVNANQTHLLALYRKCVHLGCSVPFCERSMLFECPCHGSKYRYNGEFFLGPAPRGLDRFPVIVDGEKVIVDTGKVEIGPPRGTDTWSLFSSRQGEYCQPI
jgi:cytochrome b6-f complex iron-sulfur subunit